MLRGLQAAVLIGLCPSTVAAESVEPEVPVRSVMEKERWFRDVWYVRLAGGWSVDQTLGEIVIGGQVRIDKDRAGIVNLQIGRPLVEDFRDWPLDLVWKIGLERYFERGEQGDFWGHSMSVKGYWKRFPWSHLVRTRLGFSEGISYAWHVPRVERVEQRRKHRNTSRLLNYLDVSVDVNLGDLTRGRSLSECWLGFSIWHRSGAFGLIDIFGEVSGGSNYNTGYLECSF